MGKVIARGILIGVLLCGLYQGGNVLNVLKLENLHISKFWQNALLLLIYFVTAFIINVIFELTT